MGTPRYFEAHFRAENGRNCQKKLSSVSLEALKSMEILQWTVKCLILHLTVKTFKEKQILISKNMGAK